MKIFTGRSNCPLATEIANNLGINLGKVELYNFSDGELRVAFKENIRNEDVFIVQSTNPPAENVLELLFMLDAARRASANRVIAVVPYFGYARQDRKDEPRVPISSRVMLDLMNVLGIDRIMAMDLHSPQIQGFINTPFDHLYSSMALFNRLKIFQLNFENGVVLAPDVGSAKISQSYAKRLGVGFALIDKRRPKPNEAKVAHIVGELKNKRVIIIDDMIDTAGTICNAAETAMNQGASSVVAVGTHPVLSGHSVTRLMESPIDQVIVCNTINIPEEKRFEKLEIISVGHVFAEAIKHVTDGTSLSSMFT
jgi:ribose-phosphate pyrophosphokinase